MKEFKISTPIKAIKTNCSNTLRKFFYKPEEELVTKLDFFDEKNVDKLSLLNVKMSNRSKKEDNKNDESNLIRLTKEKNSKNWH